MSAFYVRSQRPASRAALAATMGPGRPLVTRLSRGDPTSPLYYVQSFEDLRIRAELVKGVSRMGFTGPSKVQEAAIPLLIADPPRNLIATSQSGTGKTAAFILAILNRVDPRKNYPQVICLSPTYELAVQTAEMAAKMSAYYRDIRLCCAVRGEQLPSEEQLTDHIIFGTLGKVIEWGVERRAFDLHKIAVFVLDEADIMISERGQRDQCIAFQRLLPASCQMMCFATAFECEEMEVLESMVPNPTIIGVSCFQIALDNIRQYYVRCVDWSDKCTALWDINRAVADGQTLVFCNTCETAARLALQMAECSPPDSVAMISGRLTVDRRLAVLDKFRAGQHKMLVTTDILARGIDLPATFVVVNFDVPSDRRPYQRRVGRVGRFGRHGVAVNLVRSERELEFCEAIAHIYGVPIKLLKSGAGPGKLGPFFV